MRAPLLLLFALIGLALHAQSRPEKVTLSGELRKFIDLSLLPRYEPGSMELGESTYDRTGGNNDGFEGTYSFVRRNADSSLVMLDVDGPGEINRFATPTPTSDTLDFYIDDTLHPALSIDYMDLFSGKVFPFSAPLCDTGVGGCFCYFPILFQRHCRIVSRGKKLQFHQIQYKLFAAGTAVEPFVPQFDSAEQQTIEEIAWMANRPLSLNPGKSPAVSQVVTLQPGTARTLFSRDKGGRITGIFLEPRALSTTRAKDLFLRITWDGENTPAVDCPISAFFGYGFYMPSMESLLVGVYHGLHYCNIPMPFDKAAKIELVNHSPAETYHIRSMIFHTMEKRNTALEGRFYAHFQHNTLGKDQPFHVFLSVKGKGHYIGTILMAEGKEKGSTPFFEGDDSTAVDGVFRLHGTGSEDYFNGGWYDLPGRWDHAQSMFLSGCLGYTHVEARTGGYRFMILDKIPFEHRFYHGIEHGRTSATVVDAEYTSVGFYYSDGEMQ